MFKEVTLNRFSLKVTKQNYSNEFKINFWISKHNVVKQARLFSIILLSSNTIFSVTACCLITLSIYLSTFLSPPHFNINKQIRLPVYIPYGLKNVEDQYNIVMPRLLSHHKNQPECLASFLLEFVHCPNILQAFDHDKASIKAEPVPLPFSR